jgi:hypothetical protein
MTEKQRQTKLRYRRNLKMRAIKACGGRCWCCGEARPAFLEFDHEDGLGWLHRCKSGSRSSYILHLHIIRAPDPNIRLLCANCHQAVTHTGKCPHGHPIVRPT